MGVRKTLAFLKLLGTLSDTWHAVHNNKVATQKTFHPTETKSTQDQQQKPKSLRPCLYPHHKSSATMTVFGLTITHSRGQPGQDKLS